ncbi:hypothetical protein [Chromobacterium haemolyticum]|uniref:hypothetical protein n=1 Tax=Chromobacterium haemolyticum TaxID=394935 RepID=UPI0009DA5B3B|nr:hypothetical protein [Chromobacterium haemolyticum]OQS37723.1 hypothetical protein B0T39_14900 [Chromobacterium haemolyticum]
MGGSQGKALAQVVLLNLGMGFMVSGVDQACHVGGLLAGLPLGALGWSERLKRRPLQRLLVFVALAGAAALGVHQASQALGSEDLNELAAQLRQQQAAQPTLP